MAKRASVLNQKFLTLSWSPTIGQPDGLVKVDLFCSYAANFTGSDCIANSSSGVLSLPSEECGLRAL